MTQSANSELTEAMTRVIQMGKNGRRMGHSTRRWIESRVSKLEEGDRDIALLNWMDHRVLARAVDTQASRSEAGDELSPWFEALSRFGRAYSRTQEKLRLGVELEDSEGCFERVSEPRRLATTEWIGFVPLHRNGRLGSLSVVSEGGRNRVTLEYQDLFQALLALRPEGFYLLHNHPNGDLVPSREDRLLTFEVQSIAHDLRLKFLGHGIVSSLGNHWIVV